MSIFGRIFQKKQEKSKQKYMESTADNPAVLLGTGWRTPCGRKSPIPPPFRKFSLILRKCAGFRLKM